MGRMIANDWCDTSSFKVEMVVSIFCMITWKTAKILFLTPWTAYQMWGIERRYELAEPTFCSFII